ncbi:MAG TPA: dTMP kinase [Gemmataceae bacterium]|nr:dTMP kinase [Gemmataceae bacterium]
MINPARSGGRFFSLDGIDGCGKSTQCRLLADWLRGRGYKVVQCADPGGTPIGDALRDLLLNDRYKNISLRCELFLFMASRAQLVAQVIRRALEWGEVVVCDRFLLANVVYQGHGGNLLYSPYGDDIDEDLLWDIGRFATRGIEPDLTLVLDLPEDVALSRRNRPPDRMESRPASYHGWIREGFLVEARRQPDRIHIIDASPPIEVVQQRIREEVERVLEAGPRT